MTPHACIILDRADGVASCYTVHIARVSPTAAKSKRNMLWWRRSQARTNKVSSDLALKIAYVGVGLSIQDMMTE